MNNLLPIEKFKRLMNGSLTLKCQLSLHFVFSLSIVLSSYVLVYIFNNTLYIATDDITSE